jgi:hypothetical protein|tara:strand:- start:1321 stop:1959 length:639 start_codon:yes stop_codon:yes gene_type:complete
MGRAIDLFVTYRFIKLLVTPFEKQEAYKLGIIDKNGNRITEPGTNKPTTLRLGKEKDAYTVLHKLVFNIKKLFAKVPGLRTKVGTYASALFLLKDTFKEHVDDPQVFEKEFLKYLKENGYELDDTIAEEVTLEDGKLPKGIYKLTQDIAFDEEDADTPDALEGDEIQVFEAIAPTDTILGVDVFPVIHVPTQSKIFVSAEDIKEVGIEDLEL